MFDMISASVYAGIMEIARAVENCIRVRSLAGGCGTRSDTKWICELSFLESGKSGEEGD